MTKIVKYLEEAFVQGTKPSRFNLIYASIIGALGHFLLYFVYHYLFQIKWESLPIRSVGVILCIGSLYKLKKPDFLGRYFGLYWHLMLIYVLPFIITLFCLKNDFAEPWLYWEIFMVFVLISFVPHWLIFSLDLLIGISAAILLYLLTTPEATLFPPESVNVPLYSIVLAFSIVAGYLFNQSNLLGLRYEEQQKAAEKTMVLKAMAGSIAHEMRNPLSQIRYNLEEIMLELSQSRNEVMTRPSVDAITKRVSQAQMAVNRGLHVITMTLGNFRETDVPKNELTCLSAATLTRKAIEEYGYASESERTMIVFNPEDDFIFLGEENNYTLLLYNLLVNALQFLQSEPEGRINIQLKKGESFNMILVRDNGPGISPEILPKIFDPFFTVGKKGGTGLGLAFCKQVMQSFNGEITCKSEKGKYTEFTLKLPAVEPDVIRSYESKLYEEYSIFFSGKNILIACTNPEHQAILRSMIRPLEVDIHEARNGSDVVKKLSDKKIDLALVDNSLPDMDAQALIKILKAQQIEVPVVTCQSNTPSATEDNRQTMDNALFVPLTLNEVLNTLKIALVTNRSNTKDSLNDKTILIVDDLDFNRKVIKSMLKKLGVRILEGSNGLEALRILEKEHCDLLIMDMRMPVLDGFETAKQIRSKESAFRNIPILGLSGNLDNATLKMTRECGIDESLMKPVKLKPFLQKVTTLLNVGQPA